MIFQQIKKFWIGFHWDSDVKGIFFYFFFRNLWWSQNTASELLLVLAWACNIAECNTDTPPTDDCCPDFGSRFCCQCKMAALISGGFCLPLAPPSSRWFMLRTRQTGRCVQEIMAVWKCTVDFYMFTAYRHEFEWDVQSLSVWLRLWVCKSACVTTEGAAVPSIWRALLIEAWGGSRWRNKGNSWIVRKMMTLCATWPCYDMSGKKKPHTLQ